MAIRKFKIVYVTHILLLLDSAFLKCKEISSIVEQSNELRILIAQLLVFLLCTVLVYFGSLL